MSRPGSSRNKNIPADKINLRLIMVSGKSREFLFGTFDSAGDIAQFVFDTWPEDWSEEAVVKAEVLRLIYQGRFLHNNVTLGALGLPLGKTTVMHLVPRETLPEPNSRKTSVKRAKAAAPAAARCRAPSYNWPDRPASHLHIVIRPPRCERERARVFQRRRPAGGAARRRSD